MARSKKNAKRTNSSGATLGYEVELWQMADNLRGSMDAAEYKHVVLGLIFLKYISDAFEERHAKLVGSQGSYLSVGGTLVKNNIWPHNVTLSPRILSKPC
ncbi:MAG: hypothetical protein KatS3mg067_2257 [Thermosynechococcus sp.]|nr:MAG: hypothetical protein KatS3mg067_2257 [Thermosynechococcus sp.]